jgi:CDP-diacylglycerol--serine O-phosphatidyltransferase
MWSFIPNLLTLTNLLFGFFSIIYSFQQDFLKVYYCFAVCGLCDTLDGKVARLLKAESKIGEQLDSLADMVSFVVVPVVFGYTNYQLLLPNSIYLLCGCYRLARFNVSHSTTSFEGIPTPFSCAIVLLVSHPYFQLSIKQMSFVYLFFAILMVSKFKIIKL